MDFTGRVALVTGAVSPIGRAIVARLAAGGAKLVLADVDAAALDEVAAEFARDAATVVGDLSRQSAACHAVTAAREQFGRLDILVNNAGGGVIAPFLEHTPETMQATVDRNLWTCIWCCQSSLPIMIGQNYGRIVNTGADSVRNGLWAHAMYNAAKGGVHGLTTGLAREFATYDITVNTVAPSMINTPAVEAAMRDGNPLVRRFADIIPKNRPGEPEKVASMVAYLALPEAGFVTGQVISVNGGSTML